MARKKKIKIPGLSFSPSRALGLSSLKSKISKKIGIPLTKAGRQRKVGKMLGCCIPLAVFVLGGSAISYALSRLLG